MNDKKMTTAPSIRNYTGPDATHKYALDLIDWSGQQDLKILDLRMELLKAKTDISVLKGSLEAAQNTIKLITLN